MFQRPSHLILRLHQLADRIEELPRLDPTARWKAWKTFAATHSIEIERLTLDLYKHPVDTDAIPEGLFLLRANYVHVQLMHLFDQQAQINTALAAVVAERFRVDNGRFPKDWSELTPRYVSNPILDPYTGKPLILKLIEKGIVIYSAGRDGMDEGGENLNHNHYWHYGGKGYDYSKTNIGTRVYLPTHRRGPAIQLESGANETLKQSTKEMLKLMKDGSDN